MKKIFIALMLVMLMVITVNAQDREFSSTTFKSGLEYYIDWTDIDSAVTSEYSKWLDWSDLDSICYLTYQYAGTSGDSIRILITGRMTNSSLTSTIYDSDTLNTYTVSHAQLTRSAVYPLIRIQVINTGSVANTADNDLYISLYSEGFKYLPVQTRDLRKVRK